MDEERELIEIEESQPYYYPPVFYNENEGLSKRSQREMGSFTWDWQDEMEDMPLFRSPIDIEPEDEIICKIQHISVAGELQAINFIPIEIKRKGKIIWKDPNVT